MANEANIADHRRGPGGRRSPRSRSQGGNWAGPVLRVGLVNNTPEAAFWHTHRQFVDLIRAGSRGFDVELRCYRIPSVADDSEVGADVECSLGYEGIEAIYANPPDALVVTGTEPLTPDLTAERYWSPLVDLLRWAEATVPSTFLSCLAAHAALQALDGVERRPLAVKRSGVYPQPVDQAHPLGRGLGSVAAFPHSRCNDVPGSPLQSIGYRIVIGSATGDWTVVARERARRMLVLVQGHPEYEPTTLLREFHRDLRRFAEGSTSIPPRIPVRYLDTTGEIGLKVLRASVESWAPRSGHGGFPLDALAGHIASDWSRAAVRLFANWIQDVGRRLDTCSRREHAHA